MNRFCRVTSGVLIIIEYKCKVTIVALSKSLMGYLFNRISMHEPKAQMVKNLYNNKKPGDKWWN